MKITSVAMVVAGLVAGVGCGGSDDPARPQGQAGQGGGAGGALSIACGSSALFAQEHGACDAMDAVGVPDETGAQCRCMIGFAWDGSSCVALGGCACHGLDCDKLTETQEQCEAQHAACSTAPPLSLHCGSAQMYSAQHDLCEAMDAHASPDENGMPCDCFLGYAWNGSDCVSLGDCRCVGQDCDKLTQTIEQCRSNHALCMPDPEFVSCGSSTLYSAKHDQCNAMDATAVPDENGSSCYCMLGFAWNGTECVALGDCRCAGSDCDKLTQTVEECQQAHAACR